MFYRKEDVGLRFELFMIQFIIGCMYGSIMFFLYIQDWQYTIPFIVASTGMYLLTKEYFLKKRDTIEITYIGYLLLMMVSYSACIYLLAEDKHIIDNYFFYFTFLVYTTSIPFFYMVFRNHVGLRRFY